jgi:UDP-sulfoquinovose synthase
MRVLILGGDGYLGWPTALMLAAHGHEVVAVDNYLRRTLAQQTSSEALMPNPNLEERARIFREVTGLEVSVRIGDVTDYRFLSDLVRFTMRSNLLRRTPCGAIPRRALRSTTT